MKIGLGLELFRIRMDGERFKLSNCWRTYICRFHWMICVDGSSVGWTVTPSRETAGVRFNLRLCCRYVSRTVFGIIGNYVRKNNFSRWWFYFTYLDKCVFYLKTVVFKWWFSDLLRGLVIINSRATIMSRGLEIIVLRLLRSQEFYVHWYGLIWYFDFL